MTVFTASHVEDAALEWLSGLGYAVVHGSAIAPGETDNPITWLVTRIPKMGSFTSALTLLTGDRFYRAVRLIEWCQQANWDYRLRLKGNLKRPPTRPFVIFAILWS